MTATRNRKRDGQSVQVVKRFYEAFYALDIYSVTDFCNMVGIIRSKFYKQSADPEMHIMDFSWLIPLVNAGVSSKWLLTGQGKMKKETISR